MFLYESSHLVDSMGTFVISYSASHDNWCTGTLWNRIMTAQCEGMGEVRSARYEPALLPPCPSIRVLSYSNCQEIHSRQQTGLAVQVLNFLFISSGTHWQCWCHEWGRCWTAVLCRPICEDSSCNLVWLAMHGYWCHWMSTYVLSVLSITFIFILKREVERHNRCRSSIF